MSIDGSKTSSTLRDGAAKGLDKAQGLLGTFLETARKGVDSLQKTTQTAETPAGQAFARGLEFAEKNVAAAFDHAQKLVRTTDVQEAIKLQTDYVKAQYETMKAQAQELTDKAKASAESDAPKTDAPKTEGA